MKMIKKIKLKYKKKKIKHSDDSFPDYKNFIQGRLNTVELLKDFTIDEIGNLYYEAAMGAHIDPHIDHYWHRYTYLLHVFYHPCNNHHTYHC